MGMSEMEKQEKTETLGVRDWVRNTEKDSESEEKSWWHLSQGKVKLKYLLLTSHF